MFKRCLWMLLAVSTFLFFGAPSAIAASDPLEFVGSLPIKAGRGDIQGDYLYLLQLEGLVIVDISTPAAPIVVGTVDFSTRATTFGDVFGGVSVDGDMVAAVGSEGIVLIDVSNKAQPTIVGVHDVSIRFTRSVELDYPVVYFDAFFPPNSGFSMPFGLHAVDVSNPSAPQFLSGIPSPINLPICQFRGCSPQFSPFTAGSIEMHEGYLRANLVGFTGGEVVKVDVSNPNAMQLIEEETIERSLPVIEIEGEVLYGTSRLYPRLNLYDLSPANYGTFISSLMDCSFSTRPDCPAGVQYSAIHGYFADLEVVDETAYTLTSTDLRLYDVSRDLPAETISDINNPRILAQYSQYAGRQLLRDDQHLYILGNDLKIVRYAADETEPPTDSLEFKVSQGASRAALPPSGAHVAFDVMTANTSPVSQWMYPIQVSRYSADTVGEIAPNSQLWTNNCWWWLPNLWRTGDYTCNYSVVAPSGALGNHFSSTVLVEASAENGDIFNKSVTHRIPYVEGPGVGNAAYWRANSNAIYGSLAQYADGDGDGIYETYGYLIGDTNFNRRCDQYEAWWTTTCVVMLADTAYQFVEPHHADAADKRFVMMHELVTAWLNVRSNNDYLCAQADTAINLAVLWLHRNAPGGNPMLGGDPVSGAAWDEVSWNADWLRWYNETGGQNCAIDVDTGSRTIGRESADFEPPTPANVTVSPATMAAVSHALSQNSVLRNAVNERYGETMALILRHETISADFLTRLEGTFNQLVAAVDTSAANELQALWQALNPAQYVNQSARSSWDQMNVTQAPSAVTLATTTTSTTSLVVIVALFATLLLSLTLWAKRR